MKKELTILVTLIFCSLLFISNATAQWQTNNQLSDLNSWSAQPGYMGWYNTASNVPNGQVYGSGIQTLLPNDSRYGSQIVIPTFDNQIYYRNYRAGNWDPWYKVWSSANLDPDQYLDRSVSNIRSGGTANSFINGYTFSYATAGTPWNGSLISYGGFGGSYDTQFSSDYGPDGGKHISFRTRQGDGGYWNPWYELYSSGNINKADADFAAQTVNCSNVYANGNIWAKVVKVASSNPWPDYVFKREYKLRSLSEVKKYIDRNSRLPELPSAKQIEKEGQDIGEVNRVLIQKVEELTLYLVKKDEEVKRLDTRLSKLEKKQHVLRRINK